MDENKQRLIDIQCEQCKNALTVNGFHAEIAEDAEAACRIVNDIIKDGDVVCDGGSQTLLESGIIAMLEQRNIHFHSHNRPFDSRAESDAEARKAFSADVFLASANAITQNGEIINVDGHGNRVSAMIFGPKKVILVVGYQKITADEASAFERIRRIAAPANCIRLHRETPCAKLGICRDCHNKDRICSSYVKLAYDNEQRIHVIIVKQQLGY